MRKLAKFTILFFIAICGPGVSSSRTEAKEISPDKASFVFYAPGLIGGVFKTNLANWGHVTSGAWLRKYPLAIVEHYTLGPHMEWAVGQRDIKRNMSDLTNGAATDFGPLSRYNANVGNISYRMFSTKDDSCVGFLKEYGQKMIQGLYCHANHLSEEDVKAVLDGLGIKGRGKIPNK